MKKLLAGILAAVCCCAFAAPALAEVKIEGMITTDFYYFNQSKERVLGGLVSNATTNQDSWDTTRINMAQPLNRITVRYTDPGKVVNGYIQIRAGGSRAQANMTGPFNNGFGSESAFSWEYAWIDWHINPNFYFRFGRQDQTFGGAYAPAQSLGWNDGHIIGLGYGNITAQSRDAIRAFIKFNDNIRMEIQILDPNTESYFTGANSSELALPAMAGTGAANARESNIWPRFDISLPMKFGNFTLEPGFTYLKQEWDQVFAGSDDSYDVWGLTLGGRAGFGPFSIAGEITYGQNLGPNSSHWGAANGQAVAYRPAGANANLRKIEDGETLAWWLQLGFDFGPFAIQGVVGMNKGQNDGDPAISRDAAEWDRTQWMYGMNFPIKVTKTFTITPSIFYYDLDDSAKVGGNAGTAQRNGFDTDFGSEWIIGMNFQLVF
jgi:hypothetical protein